MTVDVRVVRPFWVGGTPICLGQILHISVPVAERYVERGDAVFVHPAPTPETAVPPAYETAVLKRKPGSKPVRRGSGRFPAT